MDNVRHCSGLCSYVGSPASAHQNEHQTLEQFTKSDPRFSKLAGLSRLQKSKRLQISSSPVVSFSTVPLLAHGQKNAVSAPPTYATLLSMLAARMSLQYVDTRSTYPCVRCLRPVPATVAAPGLAASCQRCKTSQREPQPSKYPEVLPKVGQWQVRVW